MIRSIFARIITKKKISLGKGKGKQQKIEVIDFDQMIDILFMRLGIHCPNVNSQEELKYLMCLDLKYLEMVKLIKFDQIMHDLDYISIDLLRQAQDPNMEKARDKALSKLKRTRDTQLNNLKKLQAEKSALTKLPEQSTEGPGLTFQGQSQQISGVSLSTKQEKKRKRPDDKKQNMSKKTGGQSAYPT